MIFSTERSGLFAVAAWRSSAERALMFTAILLAIGGLVGAGAVPAYADPCPDGDGDGWGVAVPGCDGTGLAGLGDCDDEHADVNPGAAEICGDGKDNDCDGDFDFNLLVNDFGDPLPGTGPTGTCSLSDPPGCVWAGDPPMAPASGCCLTAGHKVCDADLMGLHCESNTPGGGIILHIPEGPYGAANCFDTQDNDCDMHYDHDDPECTGPELCNGYDDDDDGMVDEIFALGSPCMAGTGACQRHGVIVCDGLGGEKCNKVPGPVKAENSPGGAACDDGEDNDCDGLVDLADPSCQTAEVCDGADNDGDGSVDEGFPDLEGDCSIGVGVCHGNGIYVCKADGSDTMCNAVLDLSSASPEGPEGATCSDGVDNDCDGVMDAADPGCGSAGIGVTCALPFVQNGPNGASCESWNRIEFNTFGAAPGAEVIAELLALDTTGAVLAVIPVRQGEVAHLKSRLEPGAWKWVSKLNNRGIGPLAGPGRTHDVIAPIPLLRVRVKDALNEAVAYCSTVPYLDVVKPSGAVVDGSSGGGTTEVLAALPLMAAGSIRALVNGVDVFAALGIDPATTFPGTHPGGVVNINGEPVTISDIVVDVAPDTFAPSSNTLRMNITGMACGGNQVVVNATGFFPPGTNIPVTPVCHVDDGHDCGSAAVFQLSISAPTPGEIIPTVPTPVMGEVCHGLPIVKTSINGKQLDTALQTSTGSALECAGATYRLAIDTTLPQTNLFAEAVGATTELGTFDRGSNRLIASAVDDDGHRVFKTFLFAVGDPSEIIRSSVVTLPRSLERLKPSRGWTFGDVEPGRNGGYTLKAETTVTDSFVFGLEGEALDAFFAAQCASASACAEESFLTQICDFHTGPTPEEPARLDPEIPIPCACDPRVHFQAIGCTEGDGIADPMFLGDFTCHVTAMDGPGPGGSGGKLVVAVDMPPVQFLVRATGSCHGGFLWGANADVDMDVMVTLPHTGDAGCEVGSPDVCADPNHPTEGCCIPTQALNRVNFEIEERDFQGTAVACTEGDMDCCDPAIDGCITGTFAPSGVIKAEIARGGVDAGGWNVLFCLCFTSILGAVLCLTGFGVLIFFTGPVGIAIGLAILTLGGFIVTVLFGGIGVGYVVTPDILQGFDMPRITQVIPAVSPDSDLYGATDKTITTSTPVIKITGSGLTATSDVTVAATSDDPSVPDAPGFFATPAPPPMLPIDPGNTFVTISDDTLNAVFAAATTQGELTSEGCSGALATGACCTTDPPQTVGSLFPADCTTITDGPPLTGCTLLNAISGDVEGCLRAALIGTCLGLQAADLSPAAGETLCESFDPATATAKIVGQAVCHGVRGANCSTVPVPILSLGTERAICAEVPPLHIKASDTILTCARNDNPPAFLIEDQAGTPAIEALLRLNDLLAGFVVDRNHNGFDGGELTGIPSCPADGTTSDCRLLSMCLDLNIEASMLLGGTDENPELVFDLGAVMPLQRVEGEACEGDVDFKFTSDADAADEAASSDSVEDSLVDNATDATPIQRPDGISLGGLVRFTAPELFAIKTSTNPGRCFNNLEATCNVAADCGGAVCVLFQDYLGIRGTIVAEPPGSPDPDGDGKVCDNCPTDSNPGQEDSDGDGMGDVCEVP